MNTKSILKSKTFWIQLIAVASSFYPPVGAWIAANPVAAVSVLGSLNVLVRFVTKGAVTIFPDDSVDGESGGLGGPPLHLLLLMCTAAGLLCALPSCTTSVAPDGTKTTRPDAESITLGKGIAEWVVGIWRAQPPAAAPVVEPTK